MRTVEEHASIVSALLRPTPVIEVPLREAVGLVLAEDLRAGLDLPPFRNSAMDGYAVRAVDLTGFPIELPVSQDIPAGRKDVTDLTPGTAARIMTGAPLPDNADTIVQVEKTDGGEHVVVISDAPPAGIHIRTRGEDITVGTVALPAGTVVGATQIGVAAALGRATLRVRRPLHVLILSTGTELVAPGQDLEPGQIYESNSAMLAAAVEEAGGSASVAHFVTDDVTEFNSALAAVDADLIITSGGVSAGAYEVVKDALTGQGVEFAKVAMQPGMPQGAGHVGQIPIVTLPGNPVSSYVSFEVFLRPAVRAAMGLPNITRPALRLPLATALDSPPGKRQFRRGTVDTQLGTVAPWGGPGSHLLAWLAGADAIIVVPEATTRLESGELVEVWVLD
ncbi:molybdopterin molybdenumtransferase MoeA [Nakamurella silvestris]|nr:molybdopterin molybdenumtransferase MoeA [Nakamurella silvestris]